MFNGELDKLYYDGRNSWGKIRIGDFVALSLLVKTLQFQFKKEIKFFVNDGKKITNKSALQLVSYLKDCFEYSDEIDLEEPTFYGGNIWVYFNYITEFLDFRAKIENFYLDQIDKSRIVVNPVFGSIYNQDRNWSKDLFDKIVDIVQKNNYKPIVTSTSEIYKIIDIDNYSDDIDFVIDDFNHTIKEISRALIYIGGDCGPTHVASAIRKYPEKIIAIYGDKSPKRHNIADDCKKLCINENKMNIPENNELPKLDFSPRPLKSKDFLYKLQSDDNLFNSIEFFLKLESRKEVKKPEYGREKYFKEIEQNLLGRDDINNILEIGMTRKRDYKKDGGSTLLFSYIAQKLDCNFTSIDINMQFKQISKQLLKEHNLYSDNIYLVVDDCFEYCQYIDNIDVLYIDAWDWKYEGCEDKHLELVKLLEPKMNSGCDVFFDDIHDIETFEGKGKKAIPYLLERDYKIIQKGYVFWLRKKD